MALSDLKIWIPNPLEKIFKEDLPKKEQQVKKEIFLFSAKNEYESFQIALRSSVMLKNVRVEFSDLLNVSGSKISKENLKYNFVDYVPVNIDNSGLKEVVRISPGEFPDPLLEDKSIDIPPQETKTIWFTIYVPPDVEEGKYKGEVKLLTNKGTFSIDLNLKVWNFILPNESHMYLTNWIMSPSALSKFHRVKIWSSEFWNLVEMYAKNMKEHRQNVIITHLFELINFFTDERGNLIFDYQNFDKWVNIFLNNGVKLIEGSHLAGRVGTWNDPNLYSPLIKVRTKEGKIIFHSRILVGHSDFYKYIGNFLMSLRNHLKEKGWIDKFIIHLSDEPDSICAPSYKLLSKIVKDFFPEVRRIDAATIPDIVGSIDVWVPLLSGNFSSFFLERQNFDEEVWWYTCCGPRDDKYPNRFIDYPLIKVRIIHWLNYKYNVKGYLHWGYNYYKDWTGSEFIDPWKENTAKMWPPGDPFIVYPGKNNKILNSIRWEQIREGIEDYEYLYLLDKKNPKVLQKILSSILPNLTDYTRNPVDLLNMRQKIGEEIEKK
ncbi:MAG TPA: DUF6067 family protein [bacterium]|nr:DUF6067 family protein [bacterium]